ncbi:hypothetical protein HRJ34_15005 [Rhizorhabdus wittichii]|uniref:Uncharacterized protein n=1 Tax=Rhizorhabdus wittichii TaxID=160791 RepID=A0A975HBT9_9SPHN|nr:hypothetical protein [Rhizorhabdus wittichii]QTH19681.1 hypothetical protein HRJ34_15005 [Rhizorhabdus wittichii]
MANHATSRQGDHIRLSIILGKLQGHESTVMLMKGDYDDSPAYDAIEAAADKLGEACAALREAITAIQ